MSKAFIIPLFLFLTLVAARAQPGQRQRDSIRAANMADHRRMMSLLGIDSLRSGVDGMNPDAPNAANYDEAKANPFPRLPDPLIMSNGKRVRSSRVWWKKRRPEIIGLFDSEIYGRVPDDIPEVDWVVISSVDETVAGTAIRTRNLEGRVSDPAVPGIVVNMSLSVTVPADAVDPVPVILELGFNWPAGMAPANAADTLPSWKEQVIARGWGYAVMLPYTVQADYGAGLTGGIIGLSNKGLPRNPDDWGALRAWAWGASKALDFFEDDPAVDASRVAIEGHSRFGKAALVALAYDSRFATGFISSSGAGGAKLHRRNAGEVVENLAADGEYHWMAGNYLKYAGPLTWNDLPVDSHQLIALCAPRPVFISSGDRGDAWVDAKGMFMAAVAAGPVYRLLGAKALETDVYPGPGSCLTTTDVAFCQHTGGHTPGPNWPAFLEFAAGYFNR